MKKISISSGTGRTSLQVGAYAKNNGRWGYCHSFYELRQPQSLPGAGLTSYIIQGKIK